MHLKLVIALSLLAACSASFLYGDDIYIDVTRDNILVKNRLNGREVDIAFNYLTGLTGQQLIGMQINGPRITPRMFKILDRKVMLDGRYETDILRQLLYKYSGELDETTYIDLIRIMTRLVEEDKMDLRILLAFKTILSRYQELELEALLKQIYRLQEDKQQLLLQRLYRQSPYDRFLYGQSKYIQGLGDLESQRYLEDERYLRDGLRSFDIYSRKNLGFDTDKDRDADFRRYQDRLGLRSDYLTRYGLDSRRSYDREYEQTPRSLLQRAIFMIPERDTLFERRDAERMYTQGDLRRPLYRREMPTERRFETLEDIREIQRPRDLELRRLRDREQYAQRYILGQDETRIPLQRPWLYYGIQNQEQLFNRYGRKY